MRCCSSNLISIDASPRRARKASRCCAKRLLLLVLLVKFFSTLNLSSLFSSKIRSCCWLSLFVVAMPTILLRLTLFLLATATTSTFASFDCKDHTELCVNVSRPLWRANVQHADNGETILIFGEAHLRIRPSGAMQLSFPRYGDTLEISANKLYCVRDWRVAERCIVLLVIASLSVYIYYRAEFRRLWLNARLWWFAREYDRYGRLMERRKMHTN